MNLKVAAAAALGLGPALTLIAVLGICEVIPLQADALTAAPTAALLGIVTLAHGLAVFRDERQAKHRKPGYLKG